MAPLVLYKHLHEAMREELEDVTRCVVRLGSASEEGLGRVPDLCHRLSFLRALYRFHSEAEEAVIFPALDAKVRNVSRSYLMDHGAETALFDALLTKLRNLRSLEPDDAQRLACAAEGLQATVRAHLVKEEQQVFPLLLKHFGEQEQAEIVARFLCSIPLATVEKVLSWVATRASNDEHRGASLGVQKAVQDPLLRELLGRWLEPKMVEASHEAEHSRCQGSTGDDEIPGTSKVSNQGLQEGKRSRSEECSPPIRHIVLMHDAIRAEFENFHRAAISMVQAHTPNRNVLGENVKKISTSFRFLQCVCMFHSSAEDEVVFPAADAVSIRINNAILMEHSAEEKLFHIIGHTLHQMKELLLNKEEISSFGGMCEKLLSSVEKVKKLVNFHMEREEKEVLPEIELKLSHLDQCVLVWKTLLAMPLQLLERVLAWVAAELSEEETADMLKNMKLAAPNATEPALLKLLTAWLKRGKELATTAQTTDPVGMTCPSTQSSKEIPGSGLSSEAQGKPYTTKRARTGGSSPSLFLNASCAFGLDSEFVEAEGYNREVEMLADEPPAAQPIDHIFKFHKALKIELEMLEKIASTVVAGNGIMEQNLKELHGRFHFLTGLYDAHSEAEDEIVFPALESKEALHNVSHSYSLDHKEEAKLLKECKVELDALCDTSLPLHERLVKAATVQRMCAGIRHALTVHVVKEEQELWPLFADHFSREEQDLLVGQIIGRTGAEVLQVMLPWVTSALTQQEQESMHDSFRNAARNTMFDQWLSTWWKNKGDATTGKSEKSQSVTTTLEKQQSRGRMDASAGLEAVASYLNGSDGTSRGLPYAGTHEQKAEAANFKPGWESLFRMNQKQLEEAVRKVSSDASLDPQRKAYLMQNLMASRWIAAQQRSSPLNKDEENEETHQKVCKTYFDAKKNILGCKHYQRRCKLVAACCGAVVPCRFCHDEVSDHNMNRHETKVMICMICGTSQKLAKHCVGCSKEMARYFCKFCKLFDDDPKHDIYHCPFCNLCRRGKGLGIDVFHCMKCNACMSLSMKQHVCREHGLESECPICNDYLFTSSMPVKELPCGHFMHSKCFKTYSRSSYTCPICSKSMGDMTVYFKMLDAILDAERHYIPPQYKERKQSILCNDCGTRGQAPFHFVYHKCINPSCGSYNTRMA